MVVVDASKRRGLVAALAVAGDGLDVGVSATGVDLQRDVVVAEDGDVGIDKLEIAPRSGEGRREVGVTGVVEDATASGKVELDAVARGTFKGWARRRRARRRRGWGRGWG